jgi:LPS-assembly lipoprotein
LSSNLKLFPLLLLFGGLSGCGFSPLYGGAADVAQPLDQVAVANIPERNGQLLRLALQDHLQAAGAPTQQRYILNVSYSVAQQGIGEQADSSGTRTRFIANATWTLAPIGNPGTPLTVGQASTEDALNVVDQQYFAVTLENNTIDARLADELSGQITNELAAYFKTHPQAE